MSFIDQAFDGVQFVAGNPQLLLDKAIEQIVLSLAAFGVGCAIALPIGIALGHLRRGSFIAINGGNLLRALPSLAVIILGISILGIGQVNVGFALVVVGAPIVLTNAYTAVAGVDDELIEAARGQGMSELGLLLRVELPLALPLLFAGLRVALVFIIATAPLAGVAGGGGLGDIIVNQAQYGFAGVLGAAFCVTVLALGFDALLSLAQRLVTPRGLKASRAAATAAAGAA